MEMNKLKTNKPNDIIEDNIKMFNVINGIKYQIFTGGEDFIGVIIDNKKYQLNVNSNNNMDVIKAITKLIDHIIRMDKIRNFPL